jgi:aminodeoxyfutalosine synthase
VATLEELTKKVDAGERLSEQDAVELASSRDIITLGMLSTTVRRRLHSNEVTYVRVADLKLDGEAELNVDSKADAAGEVRIFQTPHTLDAAVTIVEKARNTAGATPLSAFCLYELGKLPEGLPVVLPALKKAGLNTITQAPIDRLRDPERALESLADAGLELARLTINETLEREWSDVCREVASLQTRLKSIRAFAPLARKMDAAQPTTGYEDVKRVAIARVVADNIDSIQVDWALYGPKLAQVALTFGADDIDSVAAHDDDARGLRRSPVEEIRRSIHAAGFEPIERDGKFGRR